MVHRKTLNEAQSELLEWIGEGVCCMSGCRLERLPTRRPRMRRGVVDLADTR